jgi:arylsulfatase A-like enzyme
MPAKWSEWKSGIKDPLVGDHATMLRTEKYKIIVPHGEDHGELYNIIQDPSEQYNLWSQSAYLQIKVELMKMLIDRMAFTVDPLPERKAVW